jgi:hypothetical protein
MLDPTALQNTFSQRIKVIQRKPDPLATFHWQDWRGATNSGLPRAARRDLQGFEL